MNILHILKLGLLAAAMTVSLSGCMVDSDSDGAGGVGGAGGAGGAGGTGGTGGGIMTDCMPGEFFASDDGCNACECPESGLRAEAACTERACPEPCSESACGEPCEPSFSPRTGDANGEPQAGEIPDYICNRDRECVPEYDVDSCEPVDPCEGASCGDPCQPPGGRRGPMGNTPNIPQRNYICNAELECVPFEPEAQQCGANRCEGIACGEPCAPARDQRGAPEESGDGAEAFPAEPPREFCSRDGRCVPAEDPEALMCGEPPVGNSCTGLACGDDCVVDVRPASDGAGAEPDLQPPSNGVCNQDGICIPVDEADDFICGEADAACANRECGSVCFPQDNANPPGRDGSEGAPPEEDRAPPPFRCNSAGQCVDMDQDLACR